MHISLYARNLGCCCYSGSGSHRSGTSRRPRLVVEHVVANYPIHTVVTNECRGDHAKTVIFYSVVVVSLSRVARIIATDSDIISPTIRATRAACTVCLTADVKCIVVNPVVRDPILVYSAV